MLKEKKNVCNHYKIQTKIFIKRKKEKKKEEFILTFILSKQFNFVDLRQSVKS